MKQFIAFVKKEFYHIFRDKRTLLILFGMPVVQVILFGFAITNEINEAHIVFLDKSHDVATDKIKDKILSSGYFRLNEKTPRSSADLQEIFREGKVKVAVVFGQNFYKNMLTHQSANIEILADASDPNMATTLTAYVTAIIRQYQAEEQTITGGLIGTEVKMLYNEQLKGVFLFVPGVITVILMLVSAMMTSITITREKELGTMEILMVSPLKPGLIILGKSTPYIALAMINAVTILLLAWTVFEMPIRGSLLLLLAECLLFVITSLSIGILISTITNSQQTALLISLMALMLPTILLSGFIFPINSMPLVLRYVSNIIPARWFIEIVRSIMLKGVGLEVIWTETLVLAGMALLFIVVSIKKFNIRLG